MKLPSTEDGTFPLQRLEEVPVIPTTCRCLKAPPPHGTQPNVTSKQYVMLIYSCKCWAFRTTQPSAPKRVSEPLNGAGIRRRMS